jgi:hypothetical protein
MKQKWTFYYFQYFYYSDNKELPASHSYDIINCFNIIFHQMIEYFFSLLYFLTKNFSYIFLLNSRFKLLSFSFTHWISKGFQTHWISKGFQTHWIYNNFCSFRRIWRNFKIWIQLLQAMYRSNRGTVSGYFLAGRFMTWLPVCHLLQ